MLSLSKTATSDLLSVSEYTLLFFALMVVVGLMGELRLPHWHHRMKMFELLVAIGCGGELIADGGIFFFSRRLETLSNLEIAELRKSADEARLQAGSANKQASDAIDRASQNTKEAERLREFAENERLERVKLESVVANAERETAVAKLELAKLQERMADRHLSPKQQSVIANKLCQFGGLNVEIGMYNADGEINGLAKDIAGALPVLCGKTLGWAVSISPSQVTEGFSGMQIFVYQGASSRVRAFASALYEALKSEGLQVGEPMPPPRFGSIMGGGGRVSRFKVGTPGTEAGTFVEIGIGKKP
jgi:hypothetical protein